MITGHHFFLFFFLPKKQKGTKRNKSNEISFLFLYYVHEDIDEYLVNRVIFCFALSLILTLSAFFNLLYIFRFFYSMFCFFPYLLVRYVGNVD